MTRRPVRATAAFFEDLDRQLGADRGPRGEPSVGDFQTFEPLSIVDEFATNFDDLPPLVPGRTDYRILISVGRIVRAYSVTGVLTRDGAVELLRLDIDHTHPW